MTKVYTKDEVKDIVVDLVTSCQGAKATQLAAVAVEQIAGVLESTGYDPEIVEELVAEGRLVEVEYILPDMDYRCKSFLLPQGTKVRVKNAELA
jgi:hypothetical protein